MKKKVLISLEQEELEQLDNLAESVGLDRGRFIVYMSEGFRPKRNLFNKSDNRIILKKRTTTDELLKELNDNGIQIDRFSKDYTTIDNRIEMLPVYTPLC